MLGLAGTRHAVIIEPHWNLKYFSDSFLFAPPKSNNRTTLESKGNKPGMRILGSSSNNRTTLESKAKADISFPDGSKVIIEPHWNLKLIEKRERADAKSNNRTTLESKGICRLQVKAPMKVIIEPHWNLNSFVMVMQIGTIMSDNRAILVSK